MVLAAKIGEARELVCDRVREGERAPRRRRVDESCEAVSSCIDVIVFDEFDGSFDSRSSLYWSSSLGGLLRNGKKHNL